MNMRALMNGTLCLGVVTVMGCAVADSDTPVETRTMGLNSKVVLCHTPANGDAAHTIEVNENAQQQHLGHGDVVGECGDDLDHQVTICHIPPGNEEAKHMITVGAAAEQAHLDHGDWSWDCSYGPDGPDTENDGECDPETDPFGCVLNEEDDTSTTDGDGDECLGGLCF